jgi:hypothetical protein
MRRKQQREVVYVERGGDASAKWLFWGALLGAGLALMYAPSSGEETRRNLQRKLWKLRAMTEEKLKATRSSAGSMAAAASLRPGKSWSDAWRTRAPVVGHPLTSRSRSPERLQSRRVAPIARRLYPPHAPGS